MNPRSVPPILTGLALLTALGVSAPPKAVRAQSAPVSTDVTTPAVSATEASLSKANASLPPYVQKRYAFSIVLNTTVAAADRHDKQPFAGGDVVMMQACPPGYVGAVSPMIRDYPMQRVVAMTFEADGRVLPFVKAPTAGQTDYWTLDKDRGYGLDVVMLKFRHTAGMDVHLRAKYDGINGSSVYGLVKNAGDTLSAPEKKKFLGFNEGRITSTKETMNAALVQVGILKVMGESAVDYALRVAQWTSRNIRYIADGGGSDDVANAIMNKVGGNCNQFADEQAMMLRSQGIPARILSGLDSPNPDGTRIGHVICEFWDDATATWYRLPQNSSEAADIMTCFGGRDENMLIFQVDSTVRYPFTLMRCPGASNGCGSWSIGENGKYVACVIGASDVAASWSRPISASQ